MGQHHPVGKRLDEADEPFVANCSLHDGLEWPDAIEEATDAPRVLARKPPTLLHLALLVYHANADILLMEVDADKLHDVLLVWKLGESIKRYES